VLNVLVIVTAIRRLPSGPPPVEGLLMLVVSAIAGVMFRGALILGGDDDDDGGDGGEDLSMKAVLLDTAATPPLPRVSPPAARSSLLRTVCTGWIPPWPWPSRRLSATTHWTLLRKVIIAIVTASPDSTPASEGGHQRTE
jgi:hypothetical protein